MIDPKRLEVIKNKYAYWSSWAIWAHEGSTPKSNIGDLTIFERDDLHLELNPNVVLVGLNISRGDIKYPFANFHDSRSEATDYKIRYALKETPLWGGYMTDIIKDYDEKSSGKMAAYLRANKEFERKNVEIFKGEIDALGCSNPKIIAFGNEAYSILRRNFDNVIKVPHYANYSSKETYREQVKLAW